MEWAARRPHELCHLVGWPSRLLSSSSELNLAMQEEDWLLELGRADSGAHQSVQQQGRVHQLQAGQPQLSGTASLSCSASAQLQPAPAGSTLLQCGFNMLALQERQALPPEVLRRPEQGVSFAVPLVRLESGQPTATISARTRAEQSGCRQAPQAVEAGRRCLRTRADEVCNADPPAGGQQVRLRWTPELHAHFMKAVIQSGGLAAATPAKIMKAMRVGGLSIRHIKSHLQKQRMTARILGSECADHSGVAACGAGEPRTSALGEAAPAQPAAPPATPSSSSSETPRRELEQAEPAGASQEPLGADGGRQDARQAVTCSAPTAAASQADRGAPAAPAAAAAAARDDHRLQLEGGAGRGHGGALQSGTPPGQPSAREAQARALELRAALLQQFQIQCELQRQLERRRQIQAMKEEHDRYVEQLVRRECLGTQRRQAA